MKYEEMTLQELIEKRHTAKGKELEAVGCEIKRRQDTYEKTATALNGIYATKMNHCKAWGERIACLNELGKKLEALSRIYYEGKK